MPTPVVQLNAGSIAAIVLPYDATLCSGFAPRGQGPPGCYAAMMSLIGPSGDAAATLVLMGGLARCGPSPCFQSLWMRMSAAMLAAVVDGPLGFSELIDDGKMELAAIVGELTSVSAMQHLALEDEVKESSSCSLISSCNQGTNSFLRVKSCGWEDMFPLFESGCSFWTAGVLLDGLAALCGHCWMELSLEHSMAIAGIFPPSAVEFDGSGSCIEADDCHDSSSKEASTSWDESEKKEEMLQFFVNYGKGSVVVRCSPHSIVSHVRHYGCEEYAVCGTRTLTSHDTLLQNGTESRMTLRVLCRLRGGSGGNVNVNIPGQWQCNFCHAIRCWPTRKRCYRCHTPRDFSNPNSPVRGPLGRALQPARNNVPPTRSSGPGPQTVPPRNFGNGPPPAWAGVGPMSTDVGKKDEGWRLSAGFESASKNHDSGRLC